eukprot:ctg_1005.g383
MHDLDETEHARLQKQPTMKRVEGVCSGVCG